MIRAGTFSLTQDIADSKSILMVKKNLCSASNWKKEELLL
jgi:hypothetical protein